MGLSFWHLLLVLIAIFILFGAGKLPKVMGDLGKGIRNLRDEVKAITGPKGVDLCFDPVGGDLFDQSVRCMGFGGRYLVIGFTSGRIPDISVNYPLIKGFSIIGVRAGEYGRRFPDKGRENIEAIDALAADGLKPHIGARFALNDGLAAMRHLQNRTAIGRVTLTMS